MKTRSCYRIKTWGLKIQCLYLPLNHWFCRPCRGSCERLKTVHWVSLCNQIQTVPADLRILVSLCVLLLGEQHKKLYLDFHIFSCYMFSGATYRVIYLYLWCPIPSQEFPQRVATAEASPNPPVKLLSLSTFPSSPTHSLFPTLIHSIDPLYYWPLSYSLALYPALTRSTESSLFKLIPCSHNLCTVLSPINLQPLQNPLLMLLYSYQIYHKLSYYIIRGKIKNYVSLNNLLRKRKHIGRIWK